jgi:rare lipoprotein A
MGQGWNRWTKDCKLAHINGMEMTEPTPRGQAARRCHRLAPALAMSLLAGLTACASSRLPAQHASLPTPPAPLPPASLPPDLLPAPPLPAFVSAGPEMSGTASWYRPGPGLHRTCTGETFTRDEMTAASHSFPIGTRLRVALLHQSRSIVVRVNDCMPHGHRILDLSEAAAEQLGLVNMGIARVSVTLVMLAANP